MVWKTLFLNLDVLFRYKLQKKNTYTNIRQRFVLIDFEKKTEKEREGERDRGRERTRTSESKSHPCRCMPPLIYCVPSYPYPYFQVNLGFYDFSNDSYSDE